MRIKKFELNTNYRVLKKGVKIEFSDERIISIVGLNGSGKSQLLKLINDIIIGVFSNKLNLDLDYKLKIEVQNETFIIENKIIENNINLWSILDSRNQDNLENRSTEELNKEIIKNLKSKLNIIAYSSAKNSNLSEKYKYFTLKSLDEFRKNINYGNDSYNSMDTVKYLDKDLLKKLSLVLFLFFEKKVRSILKGKINIKKLTSAMVYYKKAKYKIYDEKEKEDKIYNINHPNTLIFLDVLENIFEDDTNKKELDLEDIYQKFEINPRSFFDLLNNLEELNNTLIPPGKRKELLNMNNFLENYFSLYKKEVFNLETVFFDESIDFSYLADGELQLLATIGSIIFYENLDEDRENLFIFDEPTTHLNTNWKKEFVSLVYKSFIKKKNSQLLMSSHNLEILSDLKANQLIKLRKGEYIQIRENTFGQEYEEIAENIFETRDSLSNYSLKKIKKYDKIILKKDSSISELRKIKAQIKKELADSYERTILISKINRYIKILEERI